MTEHMYAIGRSGRDASIFARDNLEALLEIASLLQPGGYHITRLSWPAGHEPGDPQSDDWGIILVSPQGKWQLHSLDRTVDLKGG